MKIKSIIVAAFSVAALLCGVFSFVPAYAADCPVDSRFCFHEGSIDDLSKSRDAVSGIVDILAGIVGAMAVLAIVYNGTLYAFSMGDPGKAGKAKQGIVMALIGFIICFLAKMIVGFMVAAASDVEFTGIAGRLITIAGWLATIAGAGCLLAVAFGGLQMVISAGNPQKVQMGKKCIINGLIGASIAILARVIIQVAYMLVA